MKKLIIFDLDNTLAQTKSKMTLEMAELLEKLLEKFSVAVISGGSYAQYEKQFLCMLPLPDALLEKLYIFPTNATSFYRFIDKKWQNIYAENLTEEEKKNIIAAFEKTFTYVKFVPIVMPFGQILEDRGSQITFSALGQEAPHDLKKNWDPNHLRRLEMIGYLQSLIPEFECRSGGSTSIDVTRKNIDKAYGITQIEKHLNFSKEEMLFIGDAIFPGGNDYAVKQSGVESWETSGPLETKELIKKILL